jgi:hypothetical protein
MIDNPLHRPKRLDGSTKDPTGGRGYADDENPTRLSRRTARWSELMSNLLSRLNTLADDNADFDAVPLNMDEQLYLESKKTMEDLEREAGIYGREEVLDRRARLLLTDLQKMGR